MEFSCERCYKLISVDQQVISNAENKFLSLKCTHCAVDCCQCLLCDTRYYYNSKKDYRNIRKHIQDNHPDTEDANARNESQKRDDVFFDVNIDDDEDSHTYQPPAPGQHIIELEDFTAFSNTKSNVYFWQEYQCNLHGESLGGLRGIVWRSQYRRKIYDHTKITNLKDSAMLFIMAQHVMNNTEEQNQNFLMIIDYIMEHVTGFEADVGVPMDEQSMNETLKERQYGIFGNLPHEEVVLINNHACVSLIGLIQHVYAHGVPIGWTEEPDVAENIRRTDNTHGSLAMDRLLERMKSFNEGEEPTKYGYLLLWSDGFLRSYVKQKDNNVWILTVTLPDVEGCATSKFHTYCLAVGQSGNDHQPVIDYYLREIEKLTKGVYLFDPSNGKFVRVMMGLLAYIADRPERHSILNHTEAGIFGKRTLWASAIDHHNLPYCASCYRNEINILLRDRYSTDILPTCSRCCQWNMQSDSTANKKIKPPELTQTDKYPLSAHSRSPLYPPTRPVPVGHLRPLELDFFLLIVAVKFAAFNIIHAGWNKGTTLSYLKSCAIPDPVINKLFSKFSKMDPCEDEGGIAVNSTDYIPYVWRSGIPMDAWIDAGMHHVFHGVVARVMLEMEDVLSGEDRKTTFHDLVNPYLLELRSLRLDWAHIKTFPKTMWLAEDELGFARISLFVYGQFFLNIRLREACNTTPTQLRSLRQMFVSLFVMVCLLMSPTNPCVDLIERHIKVFLSACHNFASGYYTADVIPFWAGTQNFPSLLNLPRQIRTFGPIRWYWEGTRERFIQTIKKVLVSMRKTPAYFVRKMIYLQKLTTMQWLSETIKREKMAGRTSRSDRRRMYFRYESIEEVMEKVNEGQIISGLTLKLNEVHLSQHYWVVIGKKGSRMRIVPLVHDGGDKIRLCGLAYHKLRVMDHGSYSISDLTYDDIKDLARNYCLLLPFRPSVEEDFGRRFSVVFDDWHVVDWDGVKNLPTLCPHEFSSQ